MITRTCPLHKTEQKELWPGVLICEECFVKDSIRFTLKGQCPSGKNAITITRTGLRFPNNRFVKWRQDAEEQLRKELGKITTQESPINIRVKYWSGDNRRRDAPGIIDALWHLIERVKLVADDTFLGGTGCTLIFQNMGVAKGEARVEITLKPGVVNESSNENMERSTSAKLRRKTNRKRS